MTITDTAAETYPTPEPPPLHEQVHIVHPDEKLDPPYCPQLPPGALPVARLNFRTRGANADILMAWLAKLGLPERAYISRNGVYVHQSIGVRRQVLDVRYFVSVDYQTGGSWVHDQIEGRRGLRLNHEAGRCHRHHPAALDVAIDRRFAEITPELEPGEELRGSFDWVQSGGPFPKVRPPEWLDMLRDPGEAGPGTWDGWRANDHS